MVERQSDAKGQQVGPYTLLEELGSGSVGVVHLARKGETLFVVKQLRADRLGAADVLARFQREAVVASQLSHDNIARIDSASFDDDAIFIATEYVPGRTLLEVTRACEDKGETVGIDAAVGISTQILDALGYMHDVVGPGGAPMGLVHRDLSPKNVIVGLFGVVKLIDFGIARAELDDFRTKPGTILGSLTNMSPEQVAGAEVDRRADIYAVGVFLYELISGAVLIPRADPNQMLRSILKADHTPIASVSDGLPEALAEVVHRAIRREPGDRFDSAQQMNAALIEAWPTPQDAAGLAELLGWMFPEGTAVWTQSGTSEAPTQIATRFAAAAASGPEGQRAADPPASPAVALAAAPTVPKSSLRPIAIIAASVALVAAGFLISQILRPAPAAVSTPTEAATPRALSASPRARVREAITAVESKAPAPPKAAPPPTIEPHSKPAPRGPRPRSTERTKAAPAPAPKPAETRPHSELWRALTRVQKAPEDRAAFFDLHDRIQNAARLHLSGTKLQTVQAQLLSASMTLDATKLKAALDVRSRAN